MVILCSIRCERWPNYEECKWPDRNTRKIRIEYVCVVKKSKSDQSVITLSCRHLSIFKWNCNLTKWMWMYHKCIAYIDQFRKKTNNCYYGNWLIENVCTMFLGILTKLFDLFTDGSLVARLAVWIQLAWWICAFNVAPASLLVVDDADVKGIITECCIWCIGWASPTFYGGC